MYEYVARRLKILENIILIIQNSLDYLLSAKVFEKSIFRKYEKRVSGKDANFKGLYYFS